MTKRSKSIFLMAMFVLTAISTTLTMSASANSLTAFGQWQPPENFVDPVTQQIKELKLQGLNDDQITIELSALGMGWYPKTGATWLGRTLTAEELAEMPIRESLGEDAITTQVEKKSVMRTSSASWTGVSSEIVSGSMSVSSGKTQYHYLCMQLGELYWVTDWAEIVLTHNLGEAYRWNTFDSDEGGWEYYMDKNTAITAADTYVILLDGTQDGDGWHYDVWINYEWVRRGHLSNLWNHAGFQEEVSSASGQFTNDASHAVFYRNWLHNAQGWPYWTNTISTSWNANSPVRESHSMGAVSYRWETWVQN